MRNKLIALTLSACMILSGINIPSCVNAGETEEKILENVGDT